MTEPPGRTAAGPGSGSARPSLPAYRLVRPLLPPAETPPALDDAQRCVVEHAGGPLLVLAGPGTGKTTTVVESVVDRIERRGRDPDSILVLTFSRRAAGELRSRITARLGRTVREPIARTFHSYAFGVLRMRAVAVGGPPPRLLAGPEQYVVIRELLEGDALAGGAGWPAALRPALRTRGFAAELRDLLMRAIERDVDADDLAAYGERFGRPEWGAAAGFLHQYREVGALARANAYDPAELIRAALDAFDDDPELLAAEQRRRRVVFVYEYQETDPAQEQLLRRLCAGADELVVVGDPDQSIYAFRGADPTAIRRFPDVFARAGRSPAPTVARTTSNRAGTALLLASRRIDGRLGGPAAHRVLQPAAGRAPGRLDVAVLATGSEEAAYIANRLREAHLREHFAWGDMAVLVRSTVRTLPQLRRALASAGVPVQVAGDDLPLAAQPLVASFLLLLRCAGGGSVDPPDAIELLGSQFGRADALAARRLRRELLRIDGEAGGRSRSDALLAQALTDPGLLGQVRERIARPATRVARLLTAARE
ncbi:MAG: ATP-dependent helicase [Mycobacteriales bacterium]